MELFVNIKIYNVIFIAHLKLVIDLAEDSYRRRRLLIFIVIVDGEKEYEIEKLLRKRIIKRERKWFVQYLIRWLEYNSKINTWKLKRKLLRYAKKIMKKYNAANNNVALFIILRCWWNFFFVAYNTI